MHLEDSGFRILSRMENAAYAHVRHPSFHRQVFAAALVLANAFLLAYPLVIAGATSFKDAEEVCERRIHRDNLSRRDKINGVSTLLFPIHHYSSVQMGVVTTCELLWLFNSPHNTPQAATLDKKREIFIDTFHVCALQCACCSRSVLCLCLQ